MNEKQRQYQEPAVARTGDENDNDGALSPQANQALAQVAAVDSMIDSILSSASTGTYLESIRQRGGQ